MRGFQSTAFDAIPMKGVRAGSTLITSEVFFENKSFCTRKCGAEGASENERSVKRCKPKKDRAYINKSSNGEANYDSKC